MKKDFMFTSESVTEGHPDKLCDQISDAIVDHLLRQDPYSRVRAECAISSAVVFIAAHFYTSAKVDLPHVARKVIKRVGYEHYDHQEFNSKTCSIITAPQGFPPDKKYLFDEHKLTDNQIEKIHARNQVTVFGFACDQTPALMPLPIWLAHQLSRRINTVRSEGILPYLMPDGKVQVGIEYRKREPYRLHSVTISVSQRTARKPSMKALRSDILETVIEPLFKKEKIKPDKHTNIFVNPDGPIIIGGPVTHSGLTGRKSAVDTYGEYSRHSGDALSGKDPLRIDRIGAYAARYSAKNVVAAGLAKECEITLSYTIGLSRPVSLLVQTLGAEKIDDARLTEIISQHFDFRPAAVARQFNLRHIPSLAVDGFYQKLATYGHMGRIDMDIPWEMTDKVSTLQEAAGL